MKKIAALSLFSTLCVFATIYGYASTTVDPQIVTLNNKMSIIFQLPQNQEGNVLVKFKDNTETTLKEVKVDANVHHRIAINLPLLEPGIYYLEILHNGLVTRKELFIRWDGIEVVRVEKMKDHF